MYILADMVSFEMIDDTGFLINIETGKIYTLNSTGAMIMSDIIAGKTKMDIVGHIFEAFSGEQSVIEKDVECYLEMLLGGGHIEEK